MQRYILLLPLCLGLSACGLDWNVAPGAAIYCTSDTECPSGFTCSTSRNICIDGGNVLPTVLNWNVQPSTLTGTDNFTVTLTLDDDSDLPDVSLNTPVGIPLSFDSVSGFDFVYAGALTGSEAPGTYQLEATLGGTILDTFGPVTIN